MSGLDQKGTKFPNGVDVPEGKLFIDEVAVTPSAAELNILDGVLATADEINRACDVSTRIVAVTATPLTVSEASHEGKVVTLAKADGIAATLPAATGSGAKYTFISALACTSVGYTFAVTGDDIFVGTAILAVDGGDTVIMFATAADSNKITLSGTTTGGIAGAIVELIDMAADKWFVRIVSDASGSEATPFSHV